MDSEFASLELIRVFQCERKGREIAEFGSLEGLVVVNSMLATWTQILQIPHVSSNFLQ
jgi:hypothetical protein